MPPLSPEEEEARKAEQDAKDNKKKGDKGGKKGKGKNKTEVKIKFIKRLMNSWKEDQQQVLVNLYFSYKKILKNTLKNGTSKMNQKISLKNMKLSQLNN